MNKRAYVKGVKNMKKESVLKPEIEEKVSELFKVLSDQTRIKILYALKESELTVSEIVERVGISQSAISHQLKTLRDIDLVTFRKEGKNVIYRLSDNHVYNIFNQAIEHVMEDN